MEYFLLLIIFLQSHNDHPFLGNPVPVDPRCVEMQSLFFDIVPSCHLSDGADIYESIALIQGEDARFPCHS